LAGLNWQTQLRAIISDVSDAFTDFRALPRRNVKPLVKSLIEKFGSFAEVVAAPERRLAEVHGLGNSGITELKLVHAAGNARRPQETLSAVVMVEFDGLLPYHASLRRTRTIPCALSRQA
jgi:hypothetical protein